MNYNFLNETPLLKKFMEELQNTLINKNNHRIVLLPLNCYEHSLKIKADNAFLNFTLANDLSYVEQKCCKNFSSNCDDTMKLISELENLVENLQDNIFANA